MARAIDVDRVKREIRKNKEKIVISCKQKYVPLSLIYEILNKAPTLIQQNGPLTQADLDAMDYDKVWLDYGGDGEWALVVSGRIYALAVLEGAGFEDILRDEVDGETMDRPSGNYTVYRRPPEGEEDI